MNTSAAQNLQENTYQMPSSKHCAKIIPFRSADEREFFQELEMRYGCAFAQWLIDDIKKNTF